MSTRIATVVLLCVKRSMLHCLCVLTHSQTCTAKPAVQHRGREHGAAAKYISDGQCASSNTFAWCIYVAYGERRPSDWGGGLPRYRDMSVR